MPDPDPRHAKAKPAVRRVLWQRALADDPIFYLTLVKTVPELEMKWPGRFLYDLLNEISIDEVELRGGPMISAMAVHSRRHKKDDNRIEPGDGFYKTASETLKCLSLDASSKERYAFWQHERKATVKWARSHPESF